MITNNKFDNVGLATSAGFTQKIERSIKKNKNKEQEHTCINCSFQAVIQSALSIIDNILGLLNEEFIKRDGIPSIFVLDEEVFYDTGVFNISMYLGNDVENDEMLDARISFMYETLLNHDIEPKLLETALFYYYNFKMSEGCYIMKNLTIYGIDEEEDDNAADK